MLASFSVAKMLVVALECLRGNGFDCLCCESSILAVSSEA